MRAVGLHCVFAEPLNSVPERVERLAELIIDPRWPWELSLLRLGIVPGQQIDRERKRNLPRTQSLGLVQQALSAYEVSDVGVSCSAQERLNHAWMYVHTGRNVIPGSAYPLELRAFCRAEWMPEQKPIGPWLALLHELVRAVGAVHGVVVVADEDSVHDEVFLITTTRDGVRLNPRADEIDQISGSGLARHELGRRFVRHPRWGTYLRADHVAAVGGRAKIAAISPAVLVDVGDLLYVQLTESLETADSPEGTAKQRTLADLLAPITVPPR